MGVEDMINKAKEALGGDAKVDEVVDQAADAAKDAAPDQVDPMIDRPQTLPRTPSSQERHLVANAR